MIRTNIFDKNNKEIVTGDVVDFPNLDNFLSEEYKTFFNIDRMTAEIIDLGNEFDISFLKKYYSKGKQIGTYQDHLNFILDGEDTELTDSNGNVLSKEEMKKNYIEKVKLQNRKMTDFIHEEPVSNRTDSYSFMHGFIHPEKEIIKEKATGLVREQILSKPYLEDVVMTLENGFKIDLKESYILELNKESKDFVLERFMILMEGELFEGDFTHLSFETLKKKQSEHKFNFNPTNKHGEITYFSYTRNRENENKAFAEFRPINEKYRESLRAEGKSDEDVLRLGRINWRNKVKLIENDKSLMDKEEVTDMFISLTSSTDVVNKLIELGAKLTILK